MAGVTDTALDLGLVLVLGRLVGLRRTYLWSHHAVSRACRSAWRLFWPDHGDRYPRAAVFSRHFGALARTGSGWITFAGLCSRSPVLSSWRARAALKERELGRGHAAPGGGRNRCAIAEFNFPRGILIALFSGIMSSCFAFGLDAGIPIRAATLAAGTSPFSQGLPVLCVVLVGGLTTNLIWCLYLLVTNGTAKEFLGARGPSDAADGGPATAAQLSALRARGHRLVLPVLLLHHGREPNGSVRLLQLDVAYGQHHHLWHAVGIRVQGVGAITTQHQGFVWTGVVSLVIATVVIGAGNYLNAN